MDDRTWELWRTTPEHRERMVRNVLKRPTVDPAAKSPWSAPAPCSHRGEVLRAVRCRPCRGSATADIRECAIHGECCDRAGVLSDGATGQPVRACLACPDRTLHPAPSEWAVGVATAPRSPSTLRACLDSVAFNGWHPTIYAEPGTDLSGNVHGFPVVQRPARLGCYHNWRSMLEDLLRRFPNASRILTLQDDAAFAPEVRQFVEQAEWPDGCGMLSLYTAGHYQQRRRQNGPFKVTARPFWGAVAMLFRRDVAERIVADDFTRDWRGAKGNRTGAAVANLDTYIGRMVGRLGLSIWAYHPSLCQHVADRSSIGNGGRGRKGSGWRKAVRVVQRPFEEFAEHPPDRTYDFRTYAQLAADTRRWARDQLRGRIAAVCGVPRSGIPVAGIIAQELQIPFVSMDALLAGGASWRPEHSRKLRTPAGPTLVVDDSVSRGGTMRAVRDRLRGVRRPLQFGALYVTDRGRGAVDLVGQRIQVEHSFEWILFREYHADRYCVDMDGVLCEDWTGGEEERDPDAYRRHLEEARPLATVTMPLGAIVTARLERYRPETEAWLRRHGIEYRELVMFPGSLAERRRTGHAAWKADRYTHRGRRNTYLFVESDPAQAAEIHRRSGKPTLCYPTMEFRA